MTEDEEKKAREDRAKADADAGTKLDKLLSHMDSFGERMDSMHKRMDGFEEKDKARDDAEKAKCDADEEAKKKADAEKEEDKKADGDDMEMTAADKKRKDAEEEAEKKAKADADEKEKEEKAKADAARGDSASIADIRAEVAKLASVTPRFASTTDHASYADAQARADSVYQSFGRQAPPSMQAEDLNSYRLRLARELQPHSDAWKNVNLAVIAVDSAAFEVAERDIYNAARQAALSPTGLEDGQERVMSRVDRETGRKTVEFARKDSFVKDHATPPQYLTRFNTDANQRVH